jgi:tetratricopeptide (TPR) repeat protein
MEVVSVRNFRLFLGYASLISAVSLGLLAAPGAAEAQRTRVLERFLVLPPHPVDHADSIYVLELAYEIRARLEGRFRTQVTIVTTEQYCEALDASGFDCSFLPDENSALQLANFLRADSYTTSEFRRNSEPRLTLRLVDIGRSGIAGWVTVIGETGQGANDFAKAVADSIRQQVRVSENARNCSERRDRSDFRGGRERAERVFREYPNHPTAAMCVADIFAATDQPPDSLIWAYTKVTTGDPLLERAWQRLAEAHFAKGDTLGAIESSEMRLSAVPEDMDQRLSVIQMWQLQREYDRALVLVEEGLEQQPGHPTLVRQRARLCFDGQHWACAVEAFADWYESEPGLASDSGFFIQVLGAAEFADDSTARLQWTEEAVEQFPTSLRFWRQRAGILSTATADTMATLEAYRQVMDLAPEDFLAKLAYASTLVGTVVIDTAVALDTATLFRADSIMTVVRDMAGDDPGAQRMMAPFYYTPGAAIAQARTDPALAMAWLEKAIEYDVTGQITVPASFFYGLAAFFYLQPLYAEVAASESCEGAQEFDVMAKLAVERMTAGASVSQQFADQLLPSLDRISAAAEQMIAVFCSSR